MNYPLSQPTGISHKTLRKLGLTFADLLMPINSSTCLECDEFYIVHDPLNVCKDTLENGELMSCIYGEYFNISPSIYMLPMPGNNTDKYRNLIDDSYKIVTEGLERLRHDIENEENLYKLGQYVARHHKLPVMYTEQEFYQVTKPFFLFYLKYWECSHKAMLEAKTANSDEAFMDKYHEVNHLLDELKNMKGYFLGYRPNCLRYSEILPYFKYFTFQGRKFMMQKNTNISPTRLQEIFALEKIRAVRDRIRSEIESIEYKRRLDAHIRNPRDPRYADVEIPF